LNISKFPLYKKFCIVKRSVFSRGIRKRVKIEVPIKVVQVWLSLGKQHHKGMAVILWERGLTEESKLHAECPKYKCKPGETKCCCRRVLYSQPDFVAVELSLQTLCHLHGVQVMFLLRLHCELNPIKQCWRICKKEMPGVPEIIKGEQSSAQCHHNPHIEIDWFTNHLCCTALHGNSHIFSPRFANHSL